MLRQIRPFERLQEDEFQALAASAEMKHFNRYASLFREGTRAQTFVLIVRGEVSSKSSALDVEMHGPGTYFGTEALAFGEMRREASVDATEEGVDALIIHANDLQVLPMAYAEFRTHALRQILRGRPYFRGLPSAAVPPLAQIVEITYFGGHDRNLITEGDSADAFYVLLEGTVAVYISRSEQRRLKSRKSTPRYKLVTWEDKVKTISSEDEAPWFGETALFSQMPRTASVRCIAPVKVMMVRGAANLKHFLSLCPGFGNTLRTASQGFKQTDNIRRGGDVEVTSVRLAKKLARTGGQDPDTPKTKAHVAVTAVAFTAKLKRLAGGLKTGT